MAYPVHNNITIYNNTAFNATNGVVAGNGTQGNPYIIEKYDISAVSAHGIDIRNTDAYFVIRFVNISDGRSNLNDGIFFNNVTHGRIENVSIINNMDGIEISDSRNIVVVNSTVTNNYRGIALSQDARYNEVRNNNVSQNSQQNIALFSSFYNNVSSNDVFRSQSNIYLSDSDKNNITHNRIWNSSMYDVYLIQSHENNLTGNSISDSVFYGIYTAASVSNIIRNNTVWDTIYGIYLFSSSNDNLVDGNTVTDNWAGINIRISSTATVMNNVVLRNGQYGIYTLGISNSNIIKSNYVTNSNFAIHFESSSYGNIITGNTAVNNYAGVNFPEPSENNLVKHNDLTGNKIGVYFSGSGNNDITSNNITGGETGIHLDECTAGIDVTFNKLDGNIAGGIHLQNSRVVKVYNNTMSNCGVFIEGTAPDMWDSHDIPVGNIVNLKPLYYWKDKTGGTVPQGLGQLILANCKNVVVDTFSFTGGTCGLELGYSSGIIVTDVNASYNNYYGIYSYNSWDNKISDSNFDSNGKHGIFFDTGSTDNTIDNIEARNNNDSGIVIRGSNRNTIKNNTVTDNSRSGLFLDGSDENLVLNNSFSSNQYATRLDNSGNNKYVNNSITYNEYPFALYSSNTNLIYHNTIVDNVNRSIDDGDTSAWDNGYPVGGNYWSDYSGIDAKSSAGQNISGIDGIGDTPYIIDLNSKDNYPLMKPIQFVLPGSPRNPIATAGDGYVLFKWDPPAKPGSFPVHSYNIYGQSMPGMLSQWYTVGNVTSYNMSGVYDGPFHNYAVSAVSVAGEGPMSQVVKATPYEPPPPPELTPSEPRTLVAIPNSVAGNYYIGLAWEEPLSAGTEPISNYRVYRGTSSLNLSLYKIIELNLTFTDDNITRGVEYYYRISAVNGVGESPLSNEVNAVVITVPDAPINLTARAGNHHVFLSWSAPLSDGGRDVIKYNIYRSAIANKSDPKLIMTRTVSYYNDTDVRNGVKYYYRVTAKNIIGIGAYSDEIAAEPILVNLPPEIKISVNISSGHAPLAVSFTANGSDADGLIVSYMWDFGDGYTSSDKEPVHTFEVVGAYNVTLTVTDNHGAETFVNMTITVDKKPESPGPGPGPGSGDGTKDNETDDSAAVSGIEFLFISMGVSIIIIFLIALLIVIRVKDMRDKSGQTIELSRSGASMLDDQAPPVEAEIAEEDLEE